jgi:hypothetical protein
MKKSQSTEAQIIWKAYSYHNLFKDFKVQNFKVYYN